MATAAFIAVHAGAAILFAFLCHGTGSVLLRGLGSDAPLLRAAAATALGMGLFGQTLFVFGIAGLLTKPMVIAILVVMAIVAALPVGYGRLPPLATVNWLPATLPAFILALYAPVGFDATMYHLPYAKLFAREGAIVFADTLRFPVFPQLAEMLFTAALLVANDVTAQLTQWVALVVTAAATAAIAERIGGRRAAMFAAALWLGTPIALYVGGNAYVDASLAMFVTLALGAWLEWRRGGSDDWLLLCGAFAGMSAATKYHGLFFIGAFFVAVLFVRVRAAALFLAAALLFAAPWYAHIARHTGNPVFPYFESLFGPSEWHGHADAPVLKLTARDPVAMVKGIAQHAVIGPARAGSPPHSPWIVLLLPLAAGAIALERRLIYPLGAAAVYAILVSAEDWRFMLAIVPLAAICIAVTLERLVPRPTMLLAALLVLPGALWTARLIAWYGRLPVTPSGRDAFVARIVPVYPILRELNARHGTDYTVYVLYAANAAYYCDGRFLGDFFGPYRYEKVQAVRYEPEKLHALLRRFGADYIVFTEPSLKADRVPPP